MKKIKSTTANKLNFVQISPNEVKFEYKKRKFLLRENNRGVYGSGRSIALFKMNEIEFSFIKEVGWTKSDNHSCSGIEDALINEITTMDKCKEAAVKYIDALFS